MKGLRFLCVPAMLLQTILLVAQNRNVTEQQQYWAGYISTFAVSEKYSLVLDLHLVPDAFASIRGGLARQFSNGAVSAGYNFLFLNPGGGATHLNRHEHRPWAQLQYNSTISKRLSALQRFRYEARFRDKTQAGEVIDGYSFNHRIRYSSSFRFMLCKEQKKYNPFLMAANEVMLNFGKAISYNTFDQNRISVMAGLHCGNIQYQLGVMNRYVQTGPQEYSLNHTLIFWVIHRFDLRNRRHPAETQEAANPLPAFKTP